MKKSPIFIKEVTIEETWRKVGNRVYWYWRLYGQRQWTKQLTSYKEIPIIKLKLNWGDYTLKPGYKMLPERRKLMSEYDKKKFERG